MTSPRPAPADLPDGHPPEDHDFKGAAQTLQDAWHAGLKLALNDAKDAIMAGPPEKITDHIRASVRRNKDVLLRDLLFREAVDYLEGKIALQQPPPDVAAVTAVQEAFTADPDALNDAWLAPNFEAFKDELRIRLTRALVELGARRESEGSQADTAGPPADNAAQQTLPEAS